MCYEPRENADEPPRHAANAIYGCTDTHWEEFAAGLGLSTRSITGGGNEGVADGKTFAIVGVGFMVAALATGRNVGRGDDRPAIPGNGPCARRPAVSRRPAIRPVSPHPHPRARAAVGPTLDGRPLHEAATGGHAQGRVGDQRPYAA